MITQEQVESALDYLAESAKAFAEARGLRVWLEESTRTVKASVSIEAAGKTVADREATAYASQEYRDHLRKLRDAVTQEELLRAYRGAASAKVELYRTQESSRRAANV